MEYIVTYTVVYERRVHADSEDIAAEILRTEYNELDIWSTDVDVEQVGDA